MNVKTAVIVLYAVLSLLPWALGPLVPVLVVDAWAMLLAMLLLIARGRRCLKSTKGGGS